MEIVVDEWLLHYICPNALSSEKSIAFEFINRLVEKCDKMVIGRKTPFISKFYIYWNEFRGYPEVYKHFKKLNELIFYNSDKTILVNNIDETEIPEEIVEKAKNDDRYLIKLVFFSKEKIIVTTDKPLQEIYTNEKNLKIYLVDEFLNSFYRNINKI